MADAIRSASRASLTRTKKVEPWIDNDREARIALMAERYARGNDIWTNEPLKGQALLEQQGKRVIEDDDE